MKKPKPAVKVYPDGREVCQLSTKDGSLEYTRRKREMWERQGQVCSLQSSKRCIGRKHLSVKFIQFEHDEGRGMGAARRDDRIEIDGKPINSVACPYCNVEKGSIRKSALDEIAP